LYKKCKLIVKSKFECRLSLDHFNVIVLLMSSTNQFHVITFLSLFLKEEQLRVMA